jgi:hypothetical protein
LCCRQKGLQETGRALAWLNSPKERKGGATAMIFASNLLDDEAVQSCLHEIDQDYFA